MPQAENENKIRFNFISLNYNRLRTDMKLLRKIRHPFYPVDIFPQKIVGKGLHGFQFFCNLAV